MFQDGDGPVFIAPNIILEDSDSVNSIVTIDGASITSETDVETLLLLATDPNITIVRKIA